MENEPLKLTFPSWTKAEEYYNKWILEHDHTCTSSCGNDYDCPLPTFEEWAEEQEIEVTEAAEIEASDAYDILTHHKQ